MGTKLFKLAATVIALFGMLGLHAGAPTWQRVNYTSSTTFVGYMSLSYEDVSEGDYIGAFVGDECRMVAQLFSHGDTLYVSGVLHGGDIDDAVVTPEVASFKLWKNASDTEVELTGTVETMPDQVPGIYLYEIAAPEIAITSITVAGVAVDLQAGSVTVSGPDVPVEGDYVVEVADARTTVTITPSTSFEAPNNVATITLSTVGKDDVVYSITVNGPTGDPCEGVVVTSPSLSNVSICAGDALPTIDAGMEVNWYSNETDVEPIATSQTYTFTEATTIYAKAENGDGCLSDVASSTLTINDLPAGPTIEANAVCEGENFGAFVVTAGSDVVIYTDNTLSTVLVGGVPTDAGTYYATQTVEGCTSEAVEVVASYNTAPTGLSLTGPTTVCVGSEAELVSSHAIGEGVAVTGPNLEGLIFTPVEAGEATFTLTVEENGCSATTTATIVAVETASPVVTSAQPATVELNATEIPAFSIETTTGTIIWYDGNMNVIANETGTSYTPSVATDVETTFNFYVSILENGCESELVPLTLTVTNCAITTNVTGDLEFCEGGNTVLTASGDATDSYEWTLNGAVVGDEQVITVSTEGTYSVIRTSGCPSAPASATVVENLLPSVSIDIASSFLTTDVAVEVGVTPADGTLTINPDRGLTGTTFNPATAGVGTYTLTLQATSEAGCSNSTTTVVTVSDEPIVVVKTSLDSLIAVAEGILDTLTVGTTPGTFTQASYNDLATAIAIATVVSDNETATQTEVNQAVVDLQGVINGLTPIQGTGLDTQALEEAIVTATTMLAGATVGEAEGEYLQSVYDALVSERDNGIDVVANATTQLEITMALATLNVAINNFVPQGPIDVSALDAKIAEAQAAITAAVVGIEPGNYTQGSVDALTAAIVIAQAVSDNPQSPSEVSNAIVTLQNAITAFTPIPDVILVYTVLDAKIATATEKTTNAVIGTAAGEYSQESVDALVAATATASGIRTSATTQAEIDDAAAALQIAIDACQPHTENPIVVDALVTKIAEAQVLVDNATVGDEEGNYTQAEVDALQDAIDAAQAIVDAPESQDQVDGAVSTLETAIGDFDPIVLDRTGLEDAIADAEDLADDCDTQDFNDLETEINDAIDEAQDALDNATTQAEIDAATTALEAEIVRIRGLYDVYVDVTDVLADVAVNPTLTSSTVTVSGATEVETVIVSANGAVLAKIAAEGEAVEINLSSYAAGVYSITVVATDGSSKTVSVVKE